MLWNFLREEEGQDLIEYTLLLAFVALAVAALFVGMSGSITNDLDHAPANSKMLQAKASARAGS
jgi:Flp pilus assembly pilin Flp